MGSAALIETTIQQLVQRDAESLRTMLWSDEWLRAGLTAFKRRLDDGERDAVRMYFEALKLVGDRNDKTLVLLLGSLGLSDMDEVRRLVTVAKGAEDVTPEQADQQWLAFGRRRMKADPRFRVWAREVLFGEREVEAEAEPGRNGHTNGNGAHK